jgi:hypothetical protein
MYQGNYGYGWEDLTSHDTRSEASLEKISGSDLTPMAVLPHQSSGEKNENSQTLIVVLMKEVVGMKNMMRERRGM